MIHQFFPLFFFKLHQYLLLVCMILNDCLFSYLHFFIFYTVKLRAFVWDFIFIIYRICIFERIVKMMLNQRCWEEKINELLFLACLLDPCIIKKITRLVLNLLNCLCFFYSKYLGKKNIFLEIQHLITRLWIKNELKSSLLPVRRNALTNSDD